MIKAITVNHTVKDFFGNDKLLSDTENHNLTPQLVDKVCRAVASGKAHAAHFIHDDGQVDTVWRNWDDVEPGQVSHRHERTEWIREEDGKTTIREFKRRMKALLP